MDTAQYKMLPHYFSTRGILNHEDKQYQIRRPRQFQKNDGGMPSGSWLKAHPPGPNRTKQITKTNAQSNGLMYETNNSLSAWTNKRDQRSSEVVFDSNYITGLQGKSKKDGGQVAKRNLYKVTKRVRGR